MLTTLNLTGERKVDLHKIRSQVEYDSYIQTHSGQRTALEQQVADMGADKTQWLLSGYCEVCEKESIFVVDWQYSDHRIPNFRERLICPKCKLNNRQRFAMQLLKAEARQENQADKVIYLYEQVTAFYKYVQQQIKQARIIGSEYFGFDYQSGQVINGIRHEDAMDLSFDDSVIDIIMSNDVYEHVPDFRLALEEARRVLKPGGKLYFSIPFYTMYQTSRLRAVIEKGGIKHLLPEQYHGNPFIVKGSLVFNDFGWDILDVCREKGFSDAYALMYYSARCAYLGNGGQIVFVAEK